jgi:hypothetical protein
MLAAAPAWGDATIEQTLKTSGVKGIGAAEGALVQRYQGDKKWESLSTKFTGAFLSRLAGQTENVVITRVDKGVLWTLEPKERTWREEPLALPKLEPQKKKEEKEKPTVRITRSEFSVKKTGAKETVNGFPCEEYLITWLLETEDLETKAKARSTMTSSLWTTPETGAIRGVQAEEQRFNQALAKRLGADLSADEAGRMGLAALAQVGASEADIRKGLARVKSETAKLKGYPIRTVVNWRLEGEEGAAQAGAEPVDASGGLSGLFSGLVGRLAQKKVEEGVKGAPLFSSTLEVKSLGAGPVPAETFQIPAGYKKQ